MGLHTSRSQFVDISLQMMELYERVSGARMHAAYIRPGGVAQVRNVDETTYIITLCNSCNYMQLYTCNSCNYKTNVHA